MSGNQAVLGAVVIGILCLSVGAPAARADDPYSGDRVHPLRHEGAVSASFNADDIVLGAGYRYSFLPRYGLGATASFYLRPYEKDVRVWLRPQVYMQMHERRYAAALVLDKEQGMTEWFALFAGLGVGLTVADFDGTSRAPKEGGTPLAELGLCFRGFQDSAAGILRIAYRYADLRRPEKNWAYVAMGIRG